MAANLASIPFLQVSFLVSGENLEQKIRNVPSTSKHPQTLVDFLQKEQGVAFEDNVFFPLVTKRVSDLCGKIISHIEETNRLVFTNKIDIKIVSGLQIESQPAMSKGRIFFVKKAAFEILKTSNSLPSLGLKNDNEKLLRLIVSRYVNNGIFFVNPAISLMFECLKKDQPSLLDGLYHSIACDYVMQSTNKGDLLALEVSSNKQKAQGSGKGSSNSCIVS